MADDIPSARVRRCGVLGSAVTLAWGGACIGSHTVTLARLGAHTPSLNCTQRPTPLALHPAPPPATHTPAALHALAPTPANTYLPQHLPHTCPCPAHTNATQPPTQPSPTTCTHARPRALTPPPDPTPAHSPAAHLPILPAPTTCRSTLNTSLCPALTSAHTTAHTPAPTSPAAARSTPACAWCGNFASTTCGPSCACTPTW